MRKTGANLEKDNVVTKEERLRFLQALSGHPVRRSLLPLGFRLASTTGRGVGRPPLRQWYDAEGRKVDRETVIDLLTIKIEKLWGFTMTPFEASYLEARVVSLVYGTDPVHRFLHIHFDKIDGYSVPMETVWDTWRAWPRRLRVPEEKLRILLSAAGCEVSNEQLVGWHMRVEETKKCKSK